jgi:hypothetical protein
MQVKHGHRVWQGLAVGGAAVTMALLGTAASGQTAGHIDPAHDVVEMNEQNGTTVTASDNKTADITRVRFVHTGRRVAVAMRLRDYGGSWQYYGLIRTPAGYYVVMGSGHRAHKAFSLTTASSEDPIPCEGFSATVSRTKNTIRVSVPAACLDHPRWVRMGLVFFVIGQRSVFTDDALRDGGGGTVGPKLTPRLYTT